MASVEESKTDGEWDAPKDIKFDAIVVDLCFHPARNVIATGDIDGDIAIHSYATGEENHLLMKLTHHKKSCRGLKFSAPEGRKLFTISKDKSLQVIDMEKGAVSQAIKKAHSASPYSLLVVDENIVATGDDDGTFKVWDLRQQKAIMDMKENEEFISDMVIDSTKRLLLTSSGDGTLTAFDIRKHKMKLQSELFDSELLSLAVVKNQNKVICGCGEGVLNIFNWGEWGNISDRFPGHPMSIDSIVPLNDDIIFTGSFDGVVRAVNILPNRFLGVIGQHDEFPVENLSLSRCRSLLASCSHDQTVKFWNVSDVDKETIDTTKRAKKASKTKALNKAMAQDEFFADLAEPTPDTEAADGKEGSDSDADSDANSDDDDDDNVDVIVVPEDGGIDDSDALNSDDSDQLSDISDVDDEEGSEDEDDVNGGLPNGTDTRHEDCDQSSESDNES